MNNLNNNQNKAYVFPKWANRLPLIIAIGFLSFFIFIVFVFYYWFSPKNLEVGYQPVQPVPFSHRLHAGEYGIDCRYCHFTVEKAAHAAIPPTEICMNCHKAVKPDSTKLFPVRESYASGKPIKWVKVHNLPDYAYFDHSRHVNVGVSCVHCHGRIDQMDVVYQAKPLSMGWCLECHRNPAPFLRPKEFVTQLSWLPQGDPAELGRELIQKYNIPPREDCSTCHR